MVGWLYICLTHVIYLAVVVVGERRRNFVHQSMLLRIQCCSIEKGASVKLDDHHPILCFTFSGAFPNTLAVFLFVCIMSSLRYNLNCIHGSTDKHTYPWQLCVIKKDPLYLNTTWMDVEHILTDLHTVSQFHSCVEYVRQLVVQHTLWDVGGYSMVGVVSQPSCCRKNWFVPLC